ncbi:MAG: hypothetical protein RR642_17635 [Solibacillus sp.]
MAKLFHQQELVGAVPVESVRTGMEINSFPFDGGILNASFISEIYLVNKYKRIGVGCNDVYEEAGDY